MIPDVPLRFFMADHQELVDPTVGIASSLRDRKNNGTAMIPANPALTRRQIYGELEGLYTVL